MRLTIAYSKIKKRNLVLINNDTHQRETVSERPIRPPLSGICLLTFQDTQILQVKTKTQVMQLLRKKGTLMILTEC